MTIFSKSSVRRPKKSLLDLSHEKKMSINMGQLIPILSEEVIPGDTWQGNTEVMARFAPMLAPLMHRIDVYTHFFFVPNRLIWDEWETFITGGKNGTESPAMPYFSFNDNNWVNSAVKGSLMDYLGYPINTGQWAPGSPVYNVLPMRAYHEIYNQYYVDQNVGTEIDYPKTSGLQTDERISAIRRRAWEKDYFTSALPWTQRGPEVGIPLDAEWSPQYEDSSTGVRASGGSAGGGVSSYIGGQLFDQDGSGEPMRIENLTDPQTITSGNLSINQLRTATRLQRWFEKNATGGARYIEQILAHFGVVSSDARLQRPEYLGGGKTPVNISEVMQTSSTDATSPQGNLAGHGIAVGNSHRFRKSFEEHGIIMGIMSILPKSQYVNINRKHLRKMDKLEYYWPEFAHLGEQPVSSIEMYPCDMSAPSEQTFGYQPRYTEYRYIPSTVHGDFRDNLNFWHMAREFNGTPTLTESFVQANPTHRVFANTNEEDAKVYVNVYNNLKTLRPMPKYPNPSI